MKDSEIIRRLEQRDESSLGGITAANVNLGREIEIRSHVNAPHNEA